MFTRIITSDAHLILEPLVGCSFDGAFFWAETIVGVQKVFVSGWLVYYAIKGALSGLRQFLAIGSPLKMIENAFLVYLKSFFHSQDI